MAPSLDTAKYPGFLKHVVSTVCGSLITLLLAAFAMGGTWNDLKRDVEAAQEAAETAAAGTHSHAATRGLHPTLAEAAENEGRIAKLEAAVESTAENVGEIKNDIREIRRLLERP